MTRTCPDCGSPLRLYRTSSSNDPADVEPRAICTNEHCRFEY